MERQLLQSIAKIIKKSIAPKITKYLREHPECFHDTVSRNGMISGLNISLSYQPKNIEQVKDTKPNIFIFLGDTKYGFEYNIFETGSVSKREWSQGEIIDVAKN